MTKVNSFIFDSYSTYFCVNLCNVFFYILTVFTFINLFFFPPNLTLPLFFPPLRALARKSVGQQGRKSINTQKRKRKMIRKSGPVLKVKSRDFSWVKLTPMSLAHLSPCLPLQRFPFLPKLTVKKKYIPSKKFTLTTSRFSKCNFSR